MQKIMFDHRRFGLEQAVLERLKTMTRRGARLPDGLEPQDVWNPVMGIDDKGKVYFTVDCIDGKQRDLYPQYQVGEVVAIGQAYGSFLKIYPEPQAEYDGDYNNMHWPAAVCRAVANQAGWKNKMFVRADLMPHHIKIKDIKMERLQDISDEDCRKEGIVYVQWKQWLWQDMDDFGPQQYKLWDVWTVPKFAESINDSWGKTDPDEFMAESPKVAFYVLIRELMGKKTWDENPWVWVYEFELIK